MHNWSLENVQNPKESKSVTIRGVSYDRRVLLADVNIPFNFTVDVNDNILYFCINADEFSDQSFHMVELELNTGSAALVAGLRNGFASAVDNSSGAVYLGGSDGIYLYDHATHQVHNPPLWRGDVFDMHFKDELYFVETATQNLYVLRDNKKQKVNRVEEHLVQHFVIDSDDNLFFVNSSQLFLSPKGAKSLILCDTGDKNFRGATVDVHGEAHFVAEDGVYTIDKRSKQLVKILSLENGYGLAFDKDNNIVYSDERSVSKLIPWENKINQ